MKVRANGIDIEVEDTGRQGDQPAVLLLMGLGMQLVSWPSAMVKALAGAGYRVIRPDNRDIGLSQGFDQLGEPNMAREGLKLRLGMKLRPGYTLQDMAADSLGVLDALGIKRAHLVGVSMGGMIARRVAISAPARTISLTSVMSSSGARGLPGAKRHIVRALLRRPPPGREAIIDSLVALLRLIGSPAFAEPEADVRARIAFSLDRSFHPAGRLRQMHAVMADDTRAGLLSRVQSPTLVIHGKEDRLVPCACGLDTARRIPGAKLALVDGMGHDLAPGALVKVLEHLLPHLAAHGEAPQRTASE